MVFQRKVNRAARADANTVGAPVGGLNGRDGLPDMDAQDAFVMDNWFPYNTSVDVRNGSQNWATGMPGPVESLAVYTGGAASKMFAFSNGAVYDVTVAGVVGASLLSGRTSNKMTTAMFSNAGSIFLLMFNGADAPYSYDGTTLAALTITGMAGSQNTLHSPHVFKGRVLLAQVDKLGFYYLGVGAIQGAASYFDLAQQSQKGGYLVSIASYSQESMGSGPQDYVIFMTSEGEYIMYAGTDPSNAANWVLVGRYFGPAPIGRRGWFKFRSDVYVITEEGVLTISQIRQMGQDAETSKYLTSKLGRLFDDLTPYQGTHGWCGFIYPKGNALYVNMPLTGSENGGYIQYVMNTNSNAWCRFTGLNGICWTLFNRACFFGTYDGKVVQNDIGTNDNGADIVATCRQAWNNFDDGKGSGDRDKQIHFATFIMQADGQLPVSCSVNMNYEDDQPSPAGSLTATNGGVWDVATWDVDAWSGTGITQNLTVPVGKIGYTASLWMTLSTQGTAVRWYATRIIMEETKGIVLQ